MVGFVSMKKLYAYISQKVVRADWTSLQAVFGRAAVTLGIFVVLGVAVAFLRVNFLASFDQLASEFFYSLRTLFLTEAVIWLTLLGNREVIIFFLIVSCALLGYWGRKENILPFLLTVLGAQFSTSVAKLVFARPRPLMQIYPEDSFSFPSGHATVVVAFYGFLLYLIWKNWRNEKAKFAAALSLLSVMLLVGLSRIYLGLHFPTDVFGGYLLGATWLILGLGAAKFMFATEQDKNLQIGARQMKFIASFLVLMAVVFFIAFGRWFFANEINKESGITVRYEKSTDL